jgi:hypothetical protein
MEKPLVAPSEGNLEALRNSIVEQVDLHWAATSTALLLTILGIHIRKYFPDSNDLMPEGLKIF